jgi:prepilin-type N-terminal cleavage/methylation domain-containing protein
MTRNRKGYTLIEVLIVGIIIAILASIAFFNYGVIFEKMKAKEGEKMLYDILAAQKAWSVEHNGQYPTSLSQLGVTFKPSNEFLPPTLVTGSPGMVGQVINGKLVLTHYFGPPPRDEWETTPDYILQIMSDGTIICSGAGVSRLCEKMGY